MPDPAPTKRTSIVLPAAVLVVVALLALVATLGGSSDGDAEPTSATPPDETSSPDEQASTDPASEEEMREALRALERREEGDALALGDVDAPVTLVQWADYQCPHCRRFATETEPELIDRFVEPGLLRIEWRDLPLIGDESLTAAVAGRAAGEQGAFWEFHAAVYDEELDRDAGHLDEEGVVRFAEAIDLDVDRFVRDLEDPRLRSEVVADATVARDLGITGTPAFLIDGQPLLGGHPTEVFVDAIESLLEEQGHEVDTDS